jgi:hypothetical protein
MRLLSDFRDYYDHWFDLNLNDAAPVFERMAGERSLSRRDVLRAFSALGIETPEHGTVTEVIDKVRTGELMNSFSPEEQERLLDMGFGDVVVYLDEYAHRGEGKERINWRTALDQYPDHYATHYIMTYPSENTGLSLRNLSVGRLRVMIRYANENDWRSNYGDPLIMPLASLEIPEDIQVPLTFHYPLYAIDYLDMGKAYKAIDFNSAPQIRGTGLENMIEPKTLVKQIEAWYAVHDPVRYIDVPGLAPEQRCRYCEALTNEQTLNTLSTA